MKIGDKVRYVGNNDGVYFNPERLWLEGFVKAVEPETVFVEFPCLVEEYSFGASNGHRWVDKVNLKIVQDRKFKVGDCVRVKADDWFYPKGAVGLVILDDGDPEDECPYKVELFGDDEDDYDLFNADQLEPWQPAVGDRVEGVGEVDTVSIDGLIGTVISVHDVVGRWFCVRFDNFNEGHEGTDSLWASKDHWNVPASSLLPSNEPQIKVGSSVVVTHSGLVPCGVGAAATVKADKDAEGFYTVVIHQEVKVPADIVKLAA